MKFRIILLLSLLLTTGSCRENVIPKPSAMLSLEFPKQHYVAYGTVCPYDFDKNVLAVVAQNKGCSMVLDYPAMKAAIYLTYRSVNNDIEVLLTDAQKLSYEHVVKADNIIEQPFVNEGSKVFGMFYEVTGNAASQSQFYVTDSVNHFLTGSLYFYAKPNYDSIYPAAVYLQKDIRRIMESLQWEKESL